MNAVCPTPKQLEEFMLGQDAEQDAAFFEQHLATCANCRDSVNTLAAEDELVEVMRAHGSHSNAPMQTEVEKLMEQLSGLRPGSPAAATEFISLQESSATSAADTENPSPELTQDIYDFLAPPEQPGEIGRLGSYSVRGVLGAGGMGVVFRAEDLQLRRPVALKVLRRKLAADSAARQRFVREAQAAAAIEHDHIVTIHQVGEDRGVPFLAMQLLLGEALDQRLKRESKLPAADVLRIGREVAEGLAAAHGHRLIHRDVKPANIWLEQRSPHASCNGYRVQILDFGLARAMQDNAALTQTGVIAGTPHYMAPEQARGEAIDARVDLFSLGCVLYEMSTGELPFPGADTFSTLTALATRSPKPPVELAPTLPRPLSDLIMNLLAKAPQARIQTAEEVVAAITQIERDQAEASVAVPVGRRPLVAVVAGLFILPLAVLGAQLGPGIYRFTTNQGQLLIETNDPDVSLTVKGAGEETTIRDAKMEHEITLKGGNYHIELSEGQDGLRLSTSNFTLERGGKVIVKVWSEPLMATLQEIRSFVGHTGQVRSVAWSSDGRRAISGGHDGTIQIWEVENGKQLRKIETRMQHVAKVAFSPDDRLILSTGGGDGIVRLWNAATGEQISALQLHGDQIHNAVFSPDGKQILAGGGERDQTMRLWDVETGNELQRFTGHGKFVWDVAFSPDGRRGLSAGWDNTVRLWDLSDGTELKRLEGHTDFVLGVLFTPDGRRALSVSRDKTVRLWNLETGIELHRFEGHTHNVEALALSADGRRLLTGGFDYSLRLWDVPSGRELHRQHSGVILSLAISPDGHHALSSGENGSVRLWRLP